MFSARNLLCAAAFTLSATAASHASAATEVYVQSVSEWTFTKGTVQGVLNGANVFKSPDMTALNIAYNFGVGPGDPTFTAWGFCIDLFTGIAAPTQYHIAEAGELGSIFTAAQQSQIFGLAAFGANLIKIGAPDLANKLAGVQGAIWAIEYPTLTVSANGSIQPYLNAYIAAAPSLTGNAYVLLSDDGKSQGFVIGVPEPATWAMMIMGFGAVGMVMRSRRRLALAA
jgi:hypothetical protein